MRAQSTDETANQVLAITQAELLERTIQGLYALGLKLEYCIALVDEAPEQARAGLDAAITNLGEVIDDMRSHIRRRA
jgi:hypothetical protein